MSTHPPEQPIPLVVRFTAQGNRALDRLAAGLIGNCDGSPASIAEILELVLSAEIEELADQLTHAPASSLPGPGPEADAAPDCHDHAARRRLDQHQHAMTHTDTAVHQRPPLGRRGGPRR